MSESNSANSFIVFMPTQNRVFKTKKVNFSLCADRKNGRKTNFEKKKLK